MACGASRTIARANLRTSTATTTSAPYVADLDERRRHGGDPLVRREDRDRSAGRRERPFLATDHRDVMASRRPIVNDAIDPTFRFMTVDWDGKIRMDCSSPYAMARLIATARQIRRRVRQRHRCRPAWHRDPVERPDESESLPRGRDLLSVRAIVPTGAAVAPSARPSSAAASSTASPRNSAASSSKCRSDSSGSSTA